MASLIIALRWLEPCPGEDATVACLSGDEVAELLHARDWLREKAGQDWGDAIPRVDVFETNASGGDKLTLRAALGYLATGCRYDTGEGIYAEEYRGFTRHGIARG